ncbi:MAG: tetratricopeptide repeat protein [Elusimicrobia bacterium]|nr:tetratricopeptide repeat protein [Elusimicrobiota bacterium]
MPAPAELAAAGRFSEAFAALAREAGVKATRVPDFRLRERDPRQDMQYGESLMLCADPKLYREARRALSRIRTAAPRSAEAWLLSGIVETILARFKDAQSLLARAGGLAPKSPWPSAWRGVARALESRRLKSQDGLREALADLDAAAQGEAARFVYPWRAELRHDLEDMEGALRDLERILSDESSSLWARVERGEILCETGRHDAALAEFDRLVRENPRASWARALRGRTLATTGREEESLSDLRRAAALDPKSASAKAWLAESLRKLGRYAEALKSLDAALRLDPRFVLAWVWRGRIRLLLGRFVDSLEDFNRAIRLDPRYQLAFAWRGEALFKLGRRQAAERDFRRVAPLDLARTWNPVLREGQRLTPEARARAFERDRAGAPA